ncbi:hypothetical protein FKM82_029410 [Ascaphus truei]
MSIYTNQLLQMRTRRGHVAWITEARVWNGMHTLTSVCTPSDLPVTALLGYFERDEERPPCRILSRNKNSILTCVGGSANEVPRRAISVH